MAWVEVSEHDYRQHFPNPGAVYLRTDFNVLNASKVEAVRFLAFAADSACDSTVATATTTAADFCLGIIVGERVSGAQKEWLSPFSAPFGGFACKVDVSIDEIDRAVCELKDFAREHNAKLHIAFAPVFYDQTYLSKCVSAMFRAGYKLAYADMNFAFNLRYDYEDLLKKRMARRNLKTALSLPYEFRKEETLEGKAIAYDVIRQNRESKNYDLKMTFDALQQTSNLVDIDFFTLYLAGSADSSDSADAVGIQKPIASAVVYRVNEKIAQVIYWGDIPNDGKNRPMNMIACKTFEFYKQAGFEFLDVGPSSIDGVPNTGLCAFKETVGCFADLKYVFEG